MKEVSDELFPHVPLTDVIYYTLYDVYSVAEVGQICEDTARLSELQQFNYPHATQHPIDVMCDCSQQTRSTVLLLAALLCEYRASR